MLGYRTSCPLAQGADSTALRGRPRAQTLPLTHRPSPDEDSPDSVYAITRTFANVYGNRQVHRQPGRPPLRASPVKAYLQDKSKGNYGEGTQTTRNPLLLFRFVGLFPEMRFQEPPCKTPRPRMSQKKALLATSHLRAQAFIIYSMRRTNTANCREQALRECGLATETSRYSAETMSTERADYDGTCTYAYRDRPLVAGARNRCCGYQEAPFVQASVPWNTTVTAGGQASLWVKKGTLRHITHAVPGLQNRVRIPTMATV